MIASNSVVVWAENCFALKCTSQTLIVVFTNAINEWFH